MNEEYDLKVEDTNEEALASKMYQLNHSVLPSRKDISMMPMRKNLPNIEENAISSSIAAIGPECMSSGD